MLKGLVSGVAIVSLTAGAVSAQVQRQDELEQVRARQKISMMEAVLVRAVSNGADNMLRKMRDVMPEPAMLTGVPEVRGFRLDGFGVFFDVDVPVLQIPFSYTLRNLVDRNGMTATAALLDLKSALARNVRDPNERARLEQSLQRLELQVGPAQPGTAAPRVSATNVAAASIAPSQPPPIAPVDPGVIDDPAEAFTREVKESLIDAMLENSGPMEIGPGEWLAVAARDNIRPDLRVPTDATDTQTMMFRVKGSDLADFHARRISLDEARKRVEIREY